MFRKSYPIPLKPGQQLKLVPIGDVHFDTEECDRDRLADLVVWARREEQQGSLVRFVGLGDYLDFMSPSNRARYVMAELYETTRKSIEEGHWQRIKEFADFVRPTHGRWLVMMTGHHNWRFGMEKVSGKWVGRTSDEWLAHCFGSDYGGDGIALIRLQLPHAQRLDVQLYHGSGGAQTLGGRVQKRAKFAEITPTAHIAISGHDNAKFAVPRSGLDYDQGTIKRYLIGSGSFQRAYLRGTDAGYAERGGMVPADLGVVVITVQVVERKGRWRVDYHASA